MPRNRQRYILDVDDLLTPSFLTPGNANNLIKGLNASANLPLAASAGGTGVVGSTSLRDGYILRYSASSQKIFSDLLNGGDLSRVAAGGDLTGFYPSPSIADNAIVFPYLATDNLVADVLNIGSVVSVVVTNAGSGYTANAVATIAPPTTVTGAQAMVSLILTTGAITGTTGLISGSGYTTSPDIILTDPGAGGAGCSILSLNVIGGVIQTGSIQIAGGGANYAGTITATINAPVTGSRAEITPTVSNGAITAFTVGNGGTNYNTTTLRPTISIQNGGTGDAAWIVASVSSGQLKAANITIKTQGTGYSANTTITVNPPPSSAYVQATVVPVITGGNITAISVTNPGSGYTSGYFTFTINDPGAGGTGATLAASVLSAPSSTSTALLGATPNGVGSFDLAWFPPPDLSFLNGEVSPVEVYNVAGGYQYYTIPAGATSVQVELYGPGGNGGAGTSNSGNTNINGGGGGGGGYIKFMISAAAITDVLSTLDGSGQLKIFVGENNDSPNNVTTIQFVVGSNSNNPGYNFGATSGIDGDSATAVGSMPAGGVGGVATYQNLPTAPAVIDGNVTVVLTGTGGPGMVGNQGGTYDAALGAYCGDGGVNGGTYLLANPTAINGPNNLRFRHSAADITALTPGTGGQCGINGSTRGRGGNGRAVITAYFGGGTGQYLLVPKVLVLFQYTYTEASATQNVQLIFSTNVQTWGFNNTASPGAVNGTSIFGTMSGNVPAYTLVIQTTVPFALPIYAIEKSYVFGSSASVSTVGMASIIQSTSEFYITFASGAFIATGGTNIITGVSLSAYGPQ